jgi:hypothetical protein
MFGERSNNSSQRLEEIASSIEQEVIKMNPGMQLTDEPRRIMVNEKRALLYMLNGPSPFQGQKEVVVLAVVERSPSEVVSAIFVAPERDYQRFEPTFQRMLGSLQMR